MARFRRRSCSTFIGLVLLIFIVTVVLKSFTPAYSPSGSIFGPKLSPNIKGPEKNDIQMLGNIDSVVPEALTKMNDIDSERVKNVEAALRQFPAPNYNIHAFYYTWYGNTQFDGKYIHWDHPLLPHWDSKVAAGYPRGRHSPPDDIGANFYPALGAYSSRDHSVIEAHMKQLRAGAIGVLAVSWYPPGMKDENGEPTDDIVPLILEVAHAYHVKVAFHIEPYKGRDETSMFNNVKYIIEKYGEHPAFYRQRTNTGKFLPLFYVYDSYLLNSEQWAKLLKHTKSSSIRDTPYDGIFIALLVEEKHKRDIVTAGFDGVYTYFATNGFSYGSTHRNWESIKTFCEDNNLLFIPSVGPGYIDTSIRPWNFQNTRNRINGKYYEMALSAALEAGADIISITSFNEWHEGTQIEMAIPKTSQTVYLDYLPHKPVVYLEVTRKWAAIFSNERKRWLE
uniref:glycoprotein endo-alpha-1,2-mannosidase-like n=1 Tax=Oncorhynchus gorbuscha TaxID=8017 RepID=UPI001EAEB86A|nr:glycoprotein endo-alpha-1,2-mannosidase-like [Oncorhynchus gorbuscha]XP_046205860.1 glycoprotein endo-alpha-1,2-mannosidase-like [Oncorhynchus gorbuscha]XP_046205861.1 glycoprotein endo-alpha-1,2-mannosidase-like [Oncorhynchus gorbuscha]XP_046205862.1 glycoprotein endo-alpha-1,2-mannosidase-like [Oncorhynchus gorbuscha]XP_046205863.1 glycoprotein endo-alpha-1,2-mannosidase-like [Oncorhynchus gorbuscha]